MKKAMTAALAFMLMFCTAFVFPASAAAAEDYEVSTIRYTDERGRAVSALAPGVLCASATVFNNAGSGDTIMFALLLYQRDKLIAADCDYCVPDSRGTSMSAELTVPDDAEECRISAVFWCGGAYGMKPISESGIFPGGEVGLKSLSVDGVPIEGFSPSRTDYEHTVAINARTAPQITAKTIDGASRVFVESPTEFPGVTTVRVVGADNEEKTYTITHKASDMGAEPPILSKEVAEGAANSALGTNLRPGALYAADRDYLLLSVPQKFMGKDYLMAVLGWQNTDAPYRAQWTDEENTIWDWLSFKLKRSATVYVVRNTTTTMGDKNLKAIGFEGPVRLTEPITGATNGTPSDYLTEFSKHYEVADEPITVELPNLVRYAYMAVIDYDGYTE